MNNKLIEFNEDPEDRASTDDRVLLNLDIIFKIVIAKNLLSGKCLV